MAEVVFIHGAGDSSAVWGLQLDSFGREHTVLAIDLPGRGSRAQEQAFDNHERNADEVVRLVQEAGLSRPVLIGHSMGGAVVQTVALRHPSLPRALVLAASGARMRMHPALLETARQQAESAPGVIAGSLVPLEMAVSPASPGEATAWLQARMGQATNQATYADFLANNAFDVMERLPDITQPTLVIAGEDDKMTPPKFQHFLAGSLPRARLALLPNAGHYLQVEQAEAFNQEVQRFLSELQG